MKKFGVIDFLFQNSTSQRSTLSLRNYGQQLSENNAWEEKMTRQEFS